MADTSIFRLSTVRKVVEAEQNREPVTIESVRNRLAGPVAEAIVALEAVITAADAVIAAEAEA